MTEAVCKMYHTGMVPRKAPVARAGHIAAGSLRYRSVAEELERRIGTGELRPGERISGENELARAFKVSRVTVRAALALLEEKALIVRRAGAGTFVAMPRLQHDLTVLENLFAQFTKLGIASSAELLEYQWSAVDAQTARTLGYSEAMRLSRLWFVGKTPFAVTFSYLHPATRAVSQTDAERQPGYLILESLGYRVDRANLKLRAERADRKIAQALHLDAHAPVLVLERTSFSASDEALEHTACYMRSDAIDFVLSVRGSASVSAAFQQQSK
ncbi:MAG: GntR family transcriptional regulator [Vulcanimicrobiaceae bacterium]